jgi:hypothetical protein
VDKDYLILNRASASRPSGQWNDDDFDVLANGIVVGRIFKANASPVGASWMWTLPSDTTKIGDRHTVMPPHVKRQWRLSRSHGDESETE